MKPIVGSTVALVTPMQEDGSIDDAALRRLIDWHIAEGTQCIGIVGTTGESPTVTVEEHCEIIRVAVEHANGRVPVMAGTGANSTAEAIELSRFALKVGADCALSVVPYYNKPSQDGIYRHFKAIAEAVDLPLVLYNVPGRTVADMSAETALRLAEIPGVIGIKDATGDIERACTLIKRRPAGFSVYSGDDGSAVALMLLGGDGNVSVTANVAPGAMQALCAAAIGGRAREAAEIQMRLLPLHQALFVEASPTPTKWALSRLGRCGAAVRLPIVPLTPAGQAVVDAALREAGCSEAGAAARRFPALHIRRRAARRAAFLEIPSVTRSVSARLPSLACLVGVLALGGCSSIENLLAGDKVDYRSASARTNGLEVPPDLTQLTKDVRYQPPASGSVSASTFQNAPAANATPAVPTVAPQAVGNLRIERLGNERWLSTTLPPEQVFPQVRAFWKDSGFGLVTDRPDAGLLETDWAENRAKLPRDMIRATVGRLLDGLYSTGELDKFRTRVERTPTGSDVFVTHRGMVEVYNNERKDGTVWQPRPTDPQLEGEFLSRLMIRLGQKEEAATAAVAATNAPTGTARARIVEGRPAATLVVDDNFERAWRRVGIALDRSGFTVEDRDRAQGLYYVRYVDPAFAGREEPGFFARMFSFGRKKTDDAGLARYRVQVKSEGATSTVAVLDSQGAPENGATGKRIVGLLLEDLK